MALDIVILAAGNGKRMQSSLPKVLHPLGGIPMLLHVVKTAQSLNPKNIYIVYGNGGKQLKESFQDLSVNWIEQTEAKGTGHALLQVVPTFNDSHQILILYGDVPLIQPATLQNLLKATAFDQIGILVANSESPSGFGRIIRDDNDNIIAIIEHKDATLEQLRINEINTGIIIAPAILLKEWLPQLKNNNAQSEYYLTDIISLAVQEKVKVISSFAKCNIEIQGINDQQELMLLERHYQLKKANELLLQGVTIVDPNRFDCRGSVQISRDVKIDINVILEGTVIIGEGTYIGPNTILKNVHVGKNVTIKSHSVLEDATIADNCIIGPFARIRPHSHLGEGVHIGNFVELKNAQVESYSKINHLSYIGDAELGSHVNVGAGTITCNYDGKNKYKTLIKHGAFIGSGTELVAPVTIGAKAYIGAGSTITKDAPDGQLTLGRATQVTIKSWGK